MWKTHAVSCKISFVTKQIDLIDYLFEEQPRRSELERLAGELLLWMETSTRFTGFVETYRDKIRKKIRVSRDAESVLDLRSELETARGLLDDRRFSVTYEPYASAKIRGPDFGVTYRQNQVFNVEVARLRKEERILRILLDKLGQMQPGMANLLVIHTPAALAQTIDLDQIMRSIKNRAEARDPSFYAASRYTGPAPFYKDFLHLSGIFLWVSAPEAAGQLWVNKQARPALDRKILQAVSSLPSGVPRSGSPISSPEQAQLQTGSIKPKS